MPLKSRSVSKRVAAGVLAVLVIAAAATTQAADMDPYYVPKAGSPYDDPRYGDIYGHPAPPPRHAEPRRYEPAPRVYRDRYGYLEPMPAPPRFDDRRQPGRDPRCLPHSEIKRALAEKGWREFQDLDRDGEIAVIAARRPNGHLYKLRIDRCTGEVVDARLIEGPADRPYAWRDRPGYRAY